MVRCAMVKQVENKILKISGTNDVEIWAHLYFLTSVV